jgi:ubiquinone/menaquinone biosynthesis C-methylase UbiE
MKALNLRENQLIGVNAFFQQEKNIMNSSTEHSAKLSPEQYAGYGSSAAPRWLAQRTAEKQAAFFLPYLRSGMDLLDCGCGPGSITLGLARAVAPGQTTGIDIDAKQVELAQSLAEEQGVSTVRFEAATVYELPFGDNSFDAVFSNAVLGHLDDPPAALREIYRVLKVGGVAGIRTADFDGHLFTPTSPIFIRYWKLFAELIAQRGGDVFLGKEQRALLHQAGFGNVRASATYDCYGTLEETRGWGAACSQMLQEDNFIKQLTKLGAERAEIESMHQAWQEWGENPDAFFAGSFCEAVCWKE